MNCGLCVRQCPGNAYCATDDNHLQDEAYYAIHSRTPETRRHAASGGFVTELLCFLLKEKRTDYCVVVPRISGSLTTRPIITNDEAQIRAAKGSKYIPVEYGRILPEIKKSSDRFTLVALPCQTEMLKRYFRKDMHRILIVTLMCNHLTGSTGTRMVLGMYHAKKDYTYDYRGNGWPGFVAVDGQIVNSHKGVYSGKFGSWFYPERCRMCDNHTGKSAQLVVADNYCWDAEKNQDGNTFCICRDEGFHDVIRQMIRAGVIEAERLPLAGPADVSRCFSGIGAMEAFVPIILSARRAMGLQVPEGAEAFQAKTAAIKNIVMYLSVKIEKFKSILYSFYIKRKYWWIK